ncbi:MAG: hypothetical protein CMO63_03630 [Verrucomicrobiales bacterium]|nr:hypothetical protein [Verrucomicrobiales bacterium]
MAVAHQFITDEKGNKTSVILPIAEYDELMEDLHDLAKAAERKDEPSIPFDEVVSQLKEDGLASSND